MTLRIVGCLIAGFLISSLSIQAMEPGAADSWKGADAVYLEVHDTYTLEEDGGMVQRHEHKLRYLTPYAVNRTLGETFIVINPSFQALEIVRAVTVMADGREVACGDNALNEMLPDFCTAAPPYMHLRETVVTHLGLEKDAVAHLIYEIRSKPDFMPFLMGEELFSGREPIEKKIVTIRVPKTVELKSRLLHKEQEPMITEEGDITQYTWILENLPMAAPEAMSQSEGDYAPRLVFSTCPSWEEASNILNGFFTRATRVDKTAAEKARNLFAESNTPVDFVRAVNRFVVDEVAFADVNPRYLGYKPMPAQAIFNHNVGCDLDKATLMVALLRSQGYFAEPVLVSTHMTVAEDVPSWTQFSDCRVITTMRDRLDKPLFLENTLYLSPTHLVNGIYEEGLAGHTVFRPSLVNNQLQKIDPLEMEKNRLKVELNLSLDDALKLSGDLSLELGGSLNPYLELVEGFEDWVSRQMKELLPGGTIKTVRPLRMGEESSIFSAAVDEPFTLKKREECDLYIYQIPHGPGSALAMHIPVAPKDRTRPLRLPKPLHEEINIRMVLPEGLEAVALPPKIAVTNAAGNVMQVAWVEDGNLAVKRLLQLPKQRIPPEEYADLRALITEWSAPDNLQVIFQKTRSENKED
ncbi:MAG: DUF3857 domain-containing protein [Planctomycetes bacterium]|nr:DUF3857 domain-containing protein [Planctomycetota bacterium]